jgi:beta-galactosidase
MIRTSFNDGWQFRPKVNPFAELSGPTAPFEPVTLPHDAMLTRGRTATADTREGGASAYFPGGAYEYRKTFFAPEESRGTVTLLELEGVYRDATVFVNGDYAGQRPYGYSRFTVDVGRLLRYGQDNEIRVECRTHQDSRWYTGAGIYRDTWLLTGGLVRIGADGVRVTTPDIDTERAVVEVVTTVENDSIVLRTHQLVTQIRDAAGALVASDTAPVTTLPREPAVARRRLYVPDPLLWGPDSPALYTCTVSLTGMGAADGDAPDVDTAETTFGIRSLRLDPERGLRINGETIKLRGACIHHDNGPLGAATFAWAEERRVRLLKEAGFNAVRMSHHPMSPAMLDACDRLGMLVVDEAFDMWTSAKSPFDYSLDFPQWWERDIEAMVAKDFNHPSVILYSIGNEIPETGTPAGAAWGRRLAEKVRALDDTRFLTNAINNLLALLSDMAALRRGSSGENGDGSGDGAGINTLMANSGNDVNAVATSELVTTRTAESYSVLDVAGMNYSEVRYGMDHELFPNRVILGAETFPSRIDELWRLVKQYDHVIGDFTWTGWDYLGEVGIGRPQYPTPKAPHPSFNAPYPALLADCGDLDITGHRLPVSYYREIVFGLRTRPYLAIGRPEHHGETPTSSRWAWSDTVAAWTWPGHEGDPVTVEVYSAADEVELLVNGRLLGRRPTGEPHRFRTEFETTYEPGELVTIAYADGVESGRDVLRTATGPVELRADVDRAAVTTEVGELAYVVLTLVDPDGTVHPAADRPVRVDVSGDGVLAGFGSAAPVTEERFDATERRTYQGRVLAIVRPTGAGTIRLTAEAPGCAAVEVLITVTEPDGRPG